MSYCSNSDVEALLAGRKIVFKDGQLTPTVIIATVPSATQVTSFIAQIYDEINETILRSGYQIPVTINNYLLSTNAMGAAYLVEMALGVSGASEALAVINMRKMAYEERLGNIAKNPRLAGAIPGEGRENNLVLSDGTSNYTANVNQGQIPFHIYQRDW